MTFSAQQPTQAAIRSPSPSPLVLCDRLITLAQDADRAGFAVTAEHLVHLAHVVLEEKPVH
jgi:hypothetical protein